MRNNGLRETESILNARNITYSDFMRDLNSLHDRVRSWRFVGEVLGTSGAYARLIAMGHRTAKPVVALRWLEYRAIAKKDEPRKRKRYYRPCVDYEIGEVVKEMGIDVNYVLLKYLEERDALP